MTRRRIEKETDYDRDVEVEALTMQLTDLIEARLQELGVSRAELARRMGVSRAHVTQTLSGQRNLTLRTVAEALYELDARLDARVVPLRKTPAPREAGVVPEDALSRAIDVVWGGSPLIRWSDRGPHGVESGSSSRVDAMRALNAAIAFEAGPEHPVIAHRPRQWLPNAPAGRSYMSAMSEVDEADYADA